MAIVATIVEFVTMFRPRAQGRYSEDFLTTYRPEVYFGEKRGDRSGPFIADAFLFLYPAILELLCLLAVAGVAASLLVRPNRSRAARRYAVAGGLALVAVAVLNVSVPSWGVIPFKTLGASYVALAAAVVAALAVAAAAVVGQRPPSAPAAGPAPR